MDGERRRRRSQTEDDLADFQAGVSKADWIADQIKTEPDVCRRETRPYPTGFGSSLSLLSFLSVDIRCYEGGVVAVGSEDMTKVSPAFYLAHGLYLFG